MTRILLICAAVSLMLIGCTPVSDQQERAQEFISNTTQKIQATATDLQQRTQKLQGGIEQVTGAVEKGRKGIDDVRGALNVSGVE